MISNFKQIGATRTDAVRLLGDPDLTAVVIGQEAPFGK